ncbi:MAG: hypothetical protein ACLFWL_14655 [Candidatus Brocadiia bacterium]
MSIFEALMLLCFGAAWPFSIYRSWKSGQNEGKSLLFLIIIFVGYVSGTIHKFVYNWDAVAFLYMLNGAMVFTDLMLYWRNARSASAATVSEEVKGEMQ